MHRNCLIKRLEMSAYFKVAEHGRSAIFSATCLAMLENVALQVAEVGCHSTTRSQQLTIFLAWLGWAWGELEYPELHSFIAKKEKCANAPLLKLSYTCKKSCWRGDTLCHGVASYCSPKQRLERQAFYLQYKHYFCDPALTIRGSKQRSPLIRLLARIISFRVK